MYPQAFNSCWLNSDWKKGSLVCQYLHYVELFLESEGPAPVHAVVMYKGRMFCVDMVDDQEEPLKPPEIQHQLTQIKDQCDREPSGIGLGALTGETRKKWAEVRADTMLACHYQQFEIPQFCSQLIFLKKCINLR